jgi:hypothetical protein
MNRLHVLFLILKINEYRSLIHNRNNESKNVHIGYIYPIPETCI